MKNDIFASKIFDLECNNRCAKFTINTRIKFVHFFFHLRQNGCYEILNLNFK